MALNTRDRSVAAQTRPRVGSGQRIRNGIVALLAVIGLVLPGYLIGAAIIDIGSFDPTSGGYDPPYTNFTGTPIQRKDVALDDDLVVIRGRVIDSEMSCRTGFWSFNLIGFTIPYRVVSERALAVHKPQVFCRESGFDTATWDRER